MPATRSFDLYPGWNNFVWTGPPGADPATALSCLHDDYSIAYHWAADRQTWLRYVPGRCAEPGLCTLTNVDTYDSLLVVVTGPTLRCQMPSTNP